MDQHQSSSRKLAYSPLKNVYPTGIYSVMLLLVCIFLVAYFQNTLIELAMDQPPAQCMIMHVIILRGE